MERVSAHDTDDTVDHMSTASIKRPLGDALGIDGFAMNYYELAPGESFSTNLHTHLDQEEVFFIIDGTATFETDDTTFDLSAGEAVRFEPGEYQHGYNETDERVAGLALGAPKESEEGRIECPDCGARSAPDIERGEKAIRFQCPDCGTEISRLT